MKAVVVLLAAIAFASVAAAPFQNLDFEQANTNRLSYDPTLGASSGSVQDLLPGWRLESILIAHPNAFPPIQSSTNLLDSLWFRSAPGLLETTATLTDGEVFPTLPKTGTYSLLLGTFHGSLFDSYLSLSQRGEVPPDATTLKLDGVFAWVGGNSVGQVTMNGVSLPGSPITGWDISAFAGQTVELTFTQFPDWSSRIDGLAFVPEPSTWVLSLLGLGGIFFLCQPGCTKGAASRSRGRIWPNKSLEWMAGERVGSKSNAHRPATTQLTR
jgi:hypothetical protein